MFSLRKGALIEFLGRRAAGAQPESDSLSPTPGAAEEVPAPSAGAMSTSSEELRAERSLVPQRGWSSEEVLKWYSDQFRDLQPETDPATTRFGGPGRADDPHPLFSSAWYCRRYAGPATSGLSAVEHYVLHGASQGKVPHPVFEMRRRYGKRARNVRPESETPQDYLVAAREAIDVFFSEEYFASRYPRIAARSSDLFRDFVLQGAVRPLDPHPLFWTEFYCQQVAEPIANSLEAVTHYVMEGADLGLDPHPLFNSRYYQDQQSDSDDGRVNPLWHYLATPRPQRHRPNPTFEPNRYLQRHPDIAASDADALLHYLRYGAREGRELE